jgi:hypothetical protein
MSDMDAVRRLQTPSMSDMDAVRHLQNNVHKQY